MSEKKVISFPTPPPEPVSEPRSNMHQRMILSMGRQRLAFDFYSTVTELNPEPALVVPFAKDKRGKGRCGKHRRSRGATGEGAAG
jgi:hypothetical protein